MGSMLKNKLQQTLLQSWSEAQVSGHFHIEVALSGGVDSVVLLHVLVSLKEQTNWDISAVHVNHQLQEVAENWPVFCQNLCQKWQVPLRVVKVKVENQAQLGVEAAARAKRYEVFEQSHASIIALAHHCDDQVETVLMALLRGGGIRALAGMPHWRNLPTGKYIWRPFLSVGKEELLRYAQEHQLPYVEDPSNEESIYTRNWLRHNILPQLIEQDPLAWSKIIAGTQQRQQELALLEEVQKSDYDKVFENKIFNVNKWLRLTPLRREQVLLYFARINQIGTWTKAKLRHFHDQLYRHPLSRHQLHLSKGILFSDRGRLYAWGDNQSMEFEEFRKFMLKYYSNGVNRIALLLALWPHLGNTDLGVNQLVLTSVGDVQAYIDKVDYSQLIRTLKSVKVPYFLIEEWPCWFDKCNSKILLVGVEDHELRQQFPIIDEKMGFLNCYLKTVGDRV